MSALAAATPYTAPLGLMDALQVTILVLVAAGATGVVLIRGPVRQVIALSVYGVLLAVLFLAFQAPDVTLSELTVGAVVLPAPAAADPGQDPEAGGVTAGGRAAGSSWPGWPGLAAFLLWGLAGLPGFGNYPGPYGDIINRVAVAQTNATGVVSAINFEYRGFDTVGEEFILFTAAVGVATVLRHLRGERERPARDEAVGRDVPPDQRSRPAVALVLIGPVVLVRVVPRLARPDQPVRRVPGRGGAGHRVRPDLPGAGEFLVFKRISPVDLTDAVEAVGAGGFAAVGVTAVAMGLPYLTNFLPLGTAPGAVSSSGTIALISFLVGIEVAAAFVLIVSELLEQTLLVREESR